MSPRTRTDQPDEDTGVTIGAIQPPPRKRERKVTLAPEVLTALQESLSPDTWTGNGVRYEGEDGAKDATTAARVYRRDLSRHMNITERRIRTRVWEQEEGVWMFALALRNENGAAA
jgi:hypothetical protein